MAKQEEEGGGWLDGVKHWLNDADLGEQQKKLRDRMRQVKTEEDAGLLNRLLDRVTGGKG